MSRIHSFPPIAAPDARILILGSMPGTASLAARQYYAHPRNLFWTILGAALGEPLAQLPYEERTAALIRHQIALWDVLHSCERTGSLDSAIKPATQIANDIAGFFQAHPAIVKVLFNGGLAETAYRRHTAGLPTPPGERLPSTSPAHAALDFASKLIRWQAALSL